MPQSWVGWNHRTLCFRNVEGRREGKLDNYVIDYTMATRVWLGINEVCRVGRNAMTKEAIDGRVGVWIQGREGSRVFLSSALDQLDLTRIVVSTAKLKVDTLGTRNLHLLYS